MLTVLSVTDAKEKILYSVSRQTAPRTVSLPDALGRVLSSPVAAKGDLPLFARSTMDGFAVRAEDTFGASEAMPALFSVTGEVMMGQAPPAALAAGRDSHRFSGGQ
ncbi:MAG: molybdopterin molybdenumtransferase MoeA, partial [Bacillota bacterium]|nr:molybdopterin molybdenumtransferase MoeA [Bacillota bacterium]